MVQWFGSLAIRTKLLLAFSVCVLLTVVAGGLGLLGMQRSDGVVEQMFHREMKGLSHVGDLRATVIDVGRLYRQILLDRDAVATRENADKVRANLDHIDEDVKVTCSPYCANG